MIGVYVHNDREEIVAEFFELFKTPWEFFDHNKYYDILITTNDNLPTDQAKLIIQFSASVSPSDELQHIEVTPMESGNFLQFDNELLPIYGKLAQIRGDGQEFLQVKNKAASAGMKTTGNNKLIIRIGYELFNEVKYLLTFGQPPENALIPALDLHISLLRTLISDAGIPFIEIPPVPAGYNFIVCLTHDIDFIRISDHKFDHTMFGFIYRATIMTLIDVIRKRRDLRDLYQNWKAVLKLPFVYLGLAQDFWFKFDRYMELESKVNAKSTFFMIPFKNKSGRKVANKRYKRRAAKYDVTDIPATVKKLVTNGHEVGLHGLDAWHDIEDAVAEKSRIESVSGAADIGIRIHWLCFDRNSYSILDEAGFSYDSTFGYNNAVGFRSGTAQAFKPPGVNNLYELPLHIQDTALFNPRHMALSSDTAWNLCEDLMQKTVKNGGILTVLWHDRSLSPERLYEDFYIKLLGELKSHNVWFATATNARNWFQFRRNTKFKKVTKNGNKFTIELENKENILKPPLRVRLYHPQTRDASFAAPQQRRYPPYVDVAWKGESNISFDL